MSSTISDIIPFQGYTYDDPFNPVAVTYYGRFWIHHTCDAYYWRVFESEADANKNHNCLRDYSMSPEEFDALCKAIKLVK